MSHRFESWSPQRTARMSAFLLLLSLIAGGFGEFWIPTKLIVYADADTTARNVLASEWMFRLGFAGYLVEALCDATLTLLFFVLLRPVSANLALLAVVLRIISTAAFAAGETFYFAALPIFKGTALHGIPIAERNAFGLLSLKLYGYGAIVPSVFYGASWIVLGYLIYRSGYLPRLLGALMAFAGFSFVASNVLDILAPGFASPYLVLPMFVGALFLMTWLLVRVSIPASGKHA